MLHEHCSFRLSFFFFFFSSRRRHTRFSRDWSSDVCSSDLNPRYPYDPAKVKALLAGAGFPNGFETVLYLPQPYAEYVKSGEIVASQWKKVGVNAKLITLEWGAWRSEEHTSELQSRENLVCR